MKETIAAFLDTVQDKLYAINDDIYHHPELGRQEYRAVEMLTGLLKEYGFTLEIGLCGYDTAFRAVLESGKPGPTVAFLCEYDALPDIGHGCGHNMIGVMGAGAGIGLATVLTRIGGKIIVLGTPAEETDGAKVAMAAQGIFAGVDAAMLLHPDGVSYASGSSLAMEAVQFAFRGKASHAAAAPEKGINALQGVIQTFNGIGALREHLAADVRIHGIITHGGAAPNIIPDYAAARFYVRAGCQRTLAEVAEKVKNCARGAALMTGTGLEISAYEQAYADMNTNQALGELFTRNLLAAGEPCIYPPRNSFGSLDMGNVSYVVPAIHPYIGIADENLVGHTVEMAKATVTPKAHAALLRGTKALAWTGYDVLTDEHELAKIWREFRQGKSVKRERC